MTTDEEAPLFLCFSSASKPVLFHHHGSLRDANSSADLAATAHALQAFASSVRASPLRSVTSSKRTVLFVAHPPLFFLIVNPASKPVHPSVLKTRLNLIHAQMVSLLTRPAMHALFDKDPGYDLRGLLAGSGERVVGSLINGFETEACAWLGAVRVGAMEMGARRRVGRAVGRVVEDTGAVFGAVFVATGEVDGIRGGEGKRVVERADDERTNRKMMLLAKDGGLALSAWDMVLLENYCAVIVGGGGGTEGSVAVTPVCLPFYNSRGNFTAYMWSSVSEHDELRVVVALAVEDVDVEAFREAANEVARVVPMHSAVASVGSVGSDGSDGSAGSEAVPYEFIFKDSRTRQYVSTDGIRASCNRCFGLMRAGMFARDDGRGELLDDHQPPLQAFRLERVGTSAYVAFASREAELYVAIGEVAGDDDEAVVKVAADLRAELVSQRERLFF